MSDLWSKLSGSGGSGRRPVRRVPVESRNVVSVMWDKVSGVSSQLSRTNLAPSFASTSGRSSRVPSSSSLAPGGVSPSASTPLVVIPPSPTVQPQFPPQPPVEVVCRCECNCTRARPQARPARRPKSLRTLLTLLLIIEAALVVLILSFLKHLYGIPFLLYGVLVASIVVLLIILILLVLIFV